MRLLILSRGFFELNSVDLDAVFGVCERSVDGECVRLIDFAAFWMLR